MKNDLNIIAKLKYNEEKAKTEKEEKVKELKWLKKDIKYRVDLVISDLLNLNNIAPNRLLNVYYKNRYDLIDKIYYSNDGYKDYNLENVKILINDILHNSIKEIATDEENAKKEDNKQVKEEMLKILIEKGKKIGYNYPLKNYKLILGEFWNMDNIDNLKIASSVVNDYKKLFREEIKEEKESEEAEEVEPVSYGLGLFGTITAILVGIISAFSDNKRR